MNSSAFLTPRRIPAFIGEERGFSLTEMLVTATVIATLCVLGITAASRLSISSREAKCRANLRTAGAAFFTYAADHHLRIHLFTYQGAGTSVTWLDYLSGNVTSAHRYTREVVGPVYLARSDAVLCPLHEPKRYNPDTRNATFGSHTRDAKDPAAYSLPDTIASSAAVRLPMIEDPSSYWLLTDTYHRTNKTQIYIVQPGASDPAGMHFRHGERAHVLFADGHVEAKTFNEMRQLRYNAPRWGIDAKGNKITP